MAKDRYIQAIRGLAIFAVVAIHSLPQCGAAVAVRPLLNWAVGMFLFLSGMLTHEEKIARGGVLRRKAVKVLVPYLVWSAVSLVVFGPRSFLGTIKALVSGGASAQLYYLLVYVQLVVLTPLIYRVLHRHRAALYAVTPLCLALRELCAIVGIALPQVQVLFPMWLIFYVLGLDWARWRGWTAARRRSLPWLCLVLYLVQAVAGLAWNAFGDYNMATTQLKLSSMALSVCAILVLSSPAPALRRRLSSSLLVGLGDRSFGIYLVHILVLAVVDKAISLIVLPLLVHTILKFSVTVLVSYLLVSVCSNHLSEKMRRALGFV